jgi:hypothetical protein
MEDDISIEECIAIFKHMIPILEGMHPNTYDMILGPTKPQRVAKALNKAIEILESQ